MSYVLLTVVGFIGGGICVFAILESKRRSLEEHRRQQDAQAERIRQAQTEIKEREMKLEEKSSRLNVERSKFEARIVSYKELLNENLILKRDLRNVDVSLRKVQLDRDLQRQKQETLDHEISDLGNRYLKDNVKWIGSSLNPNNYSSCKQRLQDVIERCRTIGLDVPASEEDALLSNLKQEYELVVRAAFEREEQARIRAQIREELMRTKEIERELKQLEWEREAIKAALEKAIADAKDQYSEEVERLKARLAEAEERSQRAISQAQLTKSGHVYVISNIGSFGEGVFKIGMTRRLDPLERIRELGSASVPFPFDVHMMISADDAPTLENTLHRKLHKLRINKASPRKEFFKTDVETIGQIVKEHRGEVNYIANAEALEYRQSLSMSEEDQEFIESVWDEVEEEGQAVEAEI